MSADKEESVVPAFHIIVRDGRHESETTIYMVCRNGSDTEEMVRAAWKEASETAKSRNPKTWILEDILDLMEADDWTVNGIEKLIELVY